ncbi:pyridoxal phosphate-dependent transferase [Mycena olivaceomarginata]|nr:pyridoxal phosphate-dependent transferase [Mycena olivaceomarginata]
MSIVSADSGKSLPETFYTPFPSDVARARLPSPRAIRGLLPLEATPGALSLLAGKPNPTTFPFTSFSFTAQSPSTENEQAASEDITLSLSGPKLAAGLQYGPTDGMAPLVDWFYAMIYSAPCTGDLLSKAIVALLNPGDARWKLTVVESPPTRWRLRAILEGWPADKTKPRVLYTIPYGGNPTGATATLARRREVLKLAREHNFLIMEDDLYFYLFDGTDRVPSYFALEHSDASCIGHPVGRILRFDSISKIVSAGIRIGFASGPTPLLRAIDLHTASVNLQPASLTQVITHALLAAWGVNGFLAHTRGVSDFYRTKRDVFEAA